MCEYIEFTCTCVLCVHLCVIKQKVDACATGLYYVNLNKHSVMYN